MKKTILLTSLISLIFFFSGCELVDKAKREYERIKHQYEEYTGNKDSRGERPFEVIYQKDENAKTAIITSSCSSNNPVQYVYFGTVTDAANRYLNETRRFISSPMHGKANPFWDIRYVNPVSKYINGGSNPQYPDQSKMTGLDARNGVDNISIGTYASQVNLGGSIFQSECINGALTEGATINLFDAPEQYINYGGPQGSFSYLISSTAHIKPWKADKTGNLMLQATFDTPLYFNYGNNQGGSVSFGLIIRNKVTHKLLNYVIGIYAAGEAWQKEKAGIRYDSTSKIIHVATVIKDNSWWCTKSPKSKEIEEISNIPNKTTKDDGKWSNFFRVNISYQNLLAVLNELKKNPPVEVAGEDFGVNPQDWEITAIMIQYEIEEQGGKASLSGSFRGFEAYISQLPL